MYKSAWFENAEREFLNRKSTGAAFDVLEHMATLGITQEEALEVVETVYILAQMDCKCSREETPYKAVHLTKEKVDFGEYFRIKTNLSQSPKVVDR